jgi:glycosyltransferase involved in cell wall biosynthesis
MNRNAKLIAWSARVAMAALLGGIFRIARIVARRQPRVLHGFSPFQGNRYYVSAARLAGFPSHTAVWYWHRHSYDLVRDQDFDRVLGGNGTAAEDLHWIAFIYVLMHADIWVAFFEGLFFHRDAEIANDWALRLIMLMGIKIIVQPHGNDMVYRSRFRPRYDWVGRMQLDYPDWDLSAQKEVAQRRIRLFSRHANLVLTGGWYMAILLPRNDAIFHTIPIDCDEIRPKSPKSFGTQNFGHSKPVIIHSPNHRHAKGTNHLIDAAQSLHTAGIESELRIIEKVPRHLALDLYQEADIIADQLCTGTIGVLGLEAMALGKPVLAYVDEAHLADPVFNHPVVNTNPENLVRVLAVLIHVPQLRERLGRAGRASVERYQSVPAMAEVWGKIYRHVWSGMPLDLESTEHFSPTRKARPFTEDPSKPEFWPVPVVDLIVEIHEALAKVKDLAIVA